MSLDIKVWKVADELNTLAMGVVSLQAGSLPLDRDAVRLHERGGPPGEH